VSGFSHVDDSPDPGRCVAYLEATAATLAAVKRRLDEMLGVRAGGRVLDVGCGAGHDLVRLAAAGAVPVGVDASARMVAESRRRCAAAGVAAVLAVADASALPLADASVDAVRVERVLQHVAVPSAVARELRRVLRPGGRLVSFEPTWASLRVDGVPVAAGAAFTRAVCAAIRQPDAGERVADWLRAAGFVGVAATTEAGGFATLDDLARATDVDAALRRAVDAGLPAAEADAWLAGLHERSGAGTFRAAVDRTYTVASVPG
jgi:SAM-dependent methyltransferase